MSANTLFLRLEGPLQSWGDQQSEFVIRRTADAPTKSGVIGLLCAALGVSRANASAEWLPKLNTLHMGVRIDRPGVRWWDYHTVGGKMQLRIAKGKGKTKPGAMLTRREYLCDASFLVALQGEPGLIASLEAAVKHPKWTLYLGRKCCPPSRPLLEHPTSHFPDLRSALTSIPWQRRLAGDAQPETVDCLLDWTPSPKQPEAPDEALVWYDVPLTFDPPSHQPRFVIHEVLDVGDGGEVEIAEKPAQNYARRAPRPRVGYGTAEYNRRRLQRLDSDQRLCVFCKSHAATVKQITYRHVDSDKGVDDLRSLCRLCYDAVTMLNYSLGMGLARIDPEDPRWREEIIRKRDEIIEFRSLKAPRQRFTAQGVQ